MAQQQEYQDVMAGLEEVGVDPFDAPIPGESMTQDTEVPMAYEQPPEFTNAQDAIEYLYMLLTEDEKYEQVLDTIRNDTPLTTIAQVALFKGFQEGKWSPDLMLLLVEPLIYVLMALAEQVGIKPIIVSEEKDNAEMLEDEQYELLSQDLKRISKKTLKQQGVPDKVSSSLLAPRKGGK